MKNKPLITILFSFILLFVVYKSIAYFILDSQITYDNIEPKIKLSQFVNISEDRTKYNRNYYFTKDFIGFNAIVDKSYYITVSKLGKTSNNYKIINTDKRSDNNSSIAGLPPADSNDLNSRYYNLDFFPFSINEIYYYVENSDEIKVNQDKFYEIEGTFTFFNVSLKGENRKDFGYVGPKRKKSVSFIKYQNNLYLLSVCPIENKKFKSLHELIN
ncbi:hypothetical protein GKZ90_0018375 [Flavobacterium sp. MC2016-06]|jgi:hypothetical protein|uniref:hypothetical protein n=1 Tax=Flavobacterium sp. MC2016-06 TaxID=2676308 RepID=UPI0012BAB216|nr:hypothetical protein [Flavobacterium sp. MC2016-06]MBU3858430.1 hypothetical protein [Flavobacterium sp. MC2016-06]